MLNLDTHILIHALCGDLTSRERDVLRSGQWGISVMVLWELAKLVQIGRIEMDLDDPDVKAALSALHVWPLDAETTAASTRLDFDGDPADELIAATSIVHRAPLATRDPVILQSNMIEFAL